MSAKSGGSGAATHVCSRLIEELQERPVWGTFGESEHMQALQSALLHIRRMWMEIVVVYIGLAQQMCRVQMLLSASSGASQSYISACGA